MKAWGSGGRSSCFGPVYGDLFDHHAVVYEYANGVRMYAICRAQNGCYNEMSDHILGTKGRCQPDQGPHRRRDRLAVRGPQGEHVRREHRSCSTSIRAGKPINNGDYMVRSTMLGDPRPDGLLHRQEDHLGGGDELPWQGWARRRQLGHGAAGQARRRRHLPGAHPRDDKLT